MNDQTADAAGVIVGVQKVVFEENQIKSADVKILTSKNGGSGSTSTLSDKTLDSRNPLLPSVNSWLKGPSAYLYEVNGMSISQLADAGERTLMLLEAGGVAPLPQACTLELGEQNTLPTGAVSGTIERLYKGRSRLRDESLDLSFVCTLLVRNRAKLYSGGDVYACRGFIKAEGTLVPGGATFRWQGRKYGVPNGVGYYRFVKGDVSRALNAGATEFASSRALPTRLVDLQEAKFAREKFPANPFVVLMNRGMCLRLIHNSTLLVNFPIEPRQSKDSLEELWERLPGDLTGQLFNRTIRLGEILVYVSVAQRTKQNFGQFYGCVNSGRSNYGTLWFKGDDGWVGGAAALKAVNAKFDLLPAKGYARLKKLATEATRATRVDPDFNDDKYVMNQRAYTADEVITVLNGVSGQTREIDLSDNNIQFDTKEKAEKFATAVNARLQERGTLNLVNNPLVKNTSAGLTVATKLFQTLGSLKVLFYSPFVTEIEDGLTELATTSGDRLKRRYYP